MERGERRLRLRVEVERLEICFKGVQRVIK